MNLVIGIIAGIVSSLGFGPVSITAIAKSLSENFRSGLMVGIGAALMDLFIQG